MARSLNELEDIGVFEIYPASHFLHLCLDIRSASVSAGGEVILYPCRRNANQRFRIRHFEGGWYVLEAIHSGMALDIYGAGGPGSKLCQYPFHGRENQLWRMEPAGSGAVRFQSAHQQLCITAPGPDINSGGIVAAEHRNDSARETQSFLLGIVK